MSQPPKTALRAVDVLDKRRDVRAISTLLLTAPGHRPFQGMPDKKSQGE